MNKIIHKTIRLNCPADGAFDMFTVNEELIRWDACFEKLYKLINE